LKEDAGKAEKFISESMSRLAVTTSAEEAAAKSDLVVEAIVEKLKIKQKLFTSLDKVFVYIL
jgi:3-hydroxyacyl-CoA dehydrogenase